MTERLIVDLGAGGRVRVAIERDQELTDFAGEPFDLAWPLDGEELDDLRWYLEDYLRAPYGADSARGERIAAALRPWGEAVFESVFGRARRAMRTCVPAHAGRRSSSCSDRPRRACWGCRGS